MISLSDAIRLESGNPAVNTFKPWWEVWIDYTLNAFLLVVLFALAGVTISGTPGLTCLPVNTNITSLNFATNFYANAKCTTHVDGHLLIVFPYIIFAEWLILFVLHLSWFNLPDLKAFLASSFDTFQVLKEEGNPGMKPKKRSKKRMGKNETSSKLPKDPLDSLPLSHENDDDDDDNPLKSGRNARLVYLVDWLQYLLQFRYNLVFLYTAKSIATCGLTTLLSAGLISSLVAFQWRTAFDCDLRGSLPPPFDNNSCSFPAAPYVYSMMILNVIFTIFLDIFNLKALFWLAKFRLEYRKYMRRDWEGKHPLKQRQGFYDYFFCIQLLKANSAEGTVIFETMEEAFHVFQKKLPDEKDDAISESSIVIPETPEHCKNEFVVTEILRKLGISIKRSSRNDLWAALANSLDQDKPSLSPKELRASIRDIHGRVLEVLLAKHALFKDLINKDDHCPMFEDYIEDVKLDEIREKGMKEDHYILMAFAIAYKVNVVVVRSEKSSLLYEPESPEANQSVWYTAFIPPHYYYATTTDTKASPEENAGLKFLTDQIYQTDLLKAVIDRWESKGYEDYKRNLQSILPRELSYQPLSPAKGMSVSEPDQKDIGLRSRAGRSKSDKNKIEQFALVETV